MVLPAHDPSPGLFTYFTGYLISFCKLKVTVIFFLHYFLALNPPPKKNISHGLSLFSAEL